MEVIEFIKPLSDITLSAIGDKAVFECTISKERVRAQWLKDGNEIYDDKKYSIFSTGNQHTLTIKKADSCDVGDYAIVVKGHRSAARLQIEAKPELTEHDKYKKGIKLKAGQSVAIEVPYNGSPQPKVTWKLDGQTLMDSRTIKVETYYNITSVLISHATRADAGTYTLKLENNYGSVTLDIDVTVLGKW